MILTAVGNYPKTPNRPRPQKLRQAIQKFQAGEISEVELRAIEDEVTVEVIHEQIEAGLDMVTDGHVRWEDEITYFARGLDGFDITGLVRYFDTNIYYRQPVATRKVTWKKPVTVSDFQFAKEKSSKPVKPSLPGPLTLAALSKWDGIYGNLEEATMAMADVINQEAKALYDAGAQIIQFDEPYIVFEKDKIPLLQRAMKRVLLGLKADTGLGTFFGDTTGITKQLVDIPTNALGLDFCTNPNNFGELKALGSEKVLGAGIVEGRNTKMEKPDELRKILDRIAAVIPSDRLLVNPSCVLDFLPREVAYEKLRNMCAALKQPAVA